MPALLRHCGRARGQLIDVCVVNTRPFSARALKHYREARGAAGGKRHRSALKRMGIKVVGDGSAAHEQPRRDGKDPARFGRGRRPWRSNWRSKGAGRGENWLHESLSVVILAAGLGTRMRSKRAKVLHRAGGLALVEHVVGAASAGFAGAASSWYTGIRPRRSRRCCSPRRRISSGRSRRREPARARMLPRERLDRDSGDLMVLYGDTPLLSAATLQRLREAQAQSGAAATLITTTLDDPSGYGRVIVDAHGKVEAIVEHKDCTPEQRDHPSHQFRHLLFRRGTSLEASERGPAQSVSRGILSHRHGGDSTAARPRGPGAAHRRSGELLGINTRVELAEADRILRASQDSRTDAFRRDDRAAGDGDDRRAGRASGADTVIEPFARLLGHDAHRRGLPHRRGSDH